MAMTLNVNAASTARRNHHVCQKNGATTRLDLRAGLVPVAVVIARRDLKL